MVDNFTGLVHFLDMEVKTRGRFSYVVRGRRGSFCLIEIKDSLHTFGWEVWKLRVYAGKGFVNRWGLRFPSDAEFGYYGWSFVRREMAEYKLKRLYNESYELEGVVVNNGYM